MIQLTDGERLHPLWLKLEAHFIESLNTLRCKNDGLISEQETNFRRGQIDQVKAFIALGKEPPIIE